MTESEESCLLTAGLYILKGSGLRGPNMWRLVTGYRVWCNYGARWRDHGVIGGKLLAGSTGFYGMMSWARSFHEFPWDSMGFRGVLLPSMIFRGHVTCSLLLGTRSIKCPGRIMVTADDARLSYHQDKRKMKRNKEGVITTGIYRIKPWHFRFNFYRHKIICSLSRWQSGH